MKNQKLNILITGAAGNIAYSMIPIIASGNFFKQGLVFGNEVQIEFFLYDIPEKQEKLTAFGLELEDCCFKNIIKVNFN